MIDGNGQTRLSVRSWADDPLSGWFPKELGYVWGVSSQLTSVGLINQQSIPLIGGGHRRFEKGLRLNLHRNRFSDHRHILDRELRLFGFPELFKLAQRRQLRQVLKAEMFEEELGRSVHDRPARHLFASDDAYELPFEERPQHAGRFHSPNFFDFGPH